MCVLELVILIWKQPSPSDKPASQLGSMFYGASIKGLSIGVRLGKASLKASDKPLFGY